MVALLPVFQQQSTLRDGQTLPLWAGAAPGALGTDDSDVPAITVFLPRTMTPNTPAMIVCPGGGYVNLALNHEAVDPVRLGLRHQRVARAQAPRGDVDGRERVGGEQRHPVAVPERAHRFAQQQHRLRAGEAARVDLAQVSAIGVHPRMLAKPAGA